MVNNPGVDKKKRLTFIWTVESGGLTHTVQMDSIASTMASQFWANMLYRDRQLRKEYHDEQAIISVAPLAYPDRKININRHRAEHGIAKRVYQKLVSDVVAKCPHCGGELN